MAYKTHAKMMHMVRREKGRLRHYAHLGTGNYHSRTARLYTDYSLLTANEALCEDVHQVFQQLSGMGRACHIETLLHAPFTLHEGMVAMIDREAQHARKGRDRNSTRLNSSHVRISYAVFCLKKKNQ